MAHIFNVAVDAVDPRRLGQFWSAATGLQISHESEDLVRLSAATFPVGTQLIFLKVDEPTPGKNKFHLDLAADDPDAEASRLLDLGASPVDALEPDGAVTWREANGIRWVVLADPEGNVFCLGPRPT